MTIFRNKTIRNHFHIYGWLNTIDPNMRHHPLQFLNFMCFTLLKFCVKNPTQSDNLSCCNKRFTISIQPKIFFSNILPNLLHIVNTTIQQLENQIDLLSLKHHIPLQSQCHSLCLKYPSQTTVHISISLLTHYH